MPGYGEVTAREIGVVLAQLSKLIGANPTNNLRLGRGLAEAGRLLSAAGDIPLRLAIKDRERRNTTVRELPDLSGMELDEVGRLANEPETNRGQLIDLGTSRFGMPRPSLERMSIDRVREEVVTAVQHERSISVISDIARRGD